MPILACVADYALDMTNPYASGRSWTPNEEKTASVLVHVISIFFEVLAPIIAYVTLRDKGPFINHNTKESINFAITVLIIYGLFAISIVGWLIFWVIPIYSTVFRLIAAVKSSQGEFYKYPLTIRFIK